MNSSGRKDDEGSRKGTKKGRDKDGRKREEQLARGKREEEFKIRREE